MVYRLWWAETNRAANTNLSSPWSWCGSKNDVTSNFYYFVCLVLWSSLGLGLSVRCCTNKLWLIILSNTETVNMNDQLQSSVHVSYDVRFLHTCCLRRGGGGREEEVTDLKSAAGPQLFTAQEFPRWARAPPPACLTHPLTSGAIRPEAAHTHTHIKVLHSMPKIHRYYQNKQRLLEIIFTSIITAQSHGSGQWFPSPAQGHRIIPGIQQVRQSSTHQGYLISLRGDQIIKEERKLWNYRK